MLIVADVHGAARRLALVAERARASGEALLVLGDLINFIDYRTNEGIVSEVSGPDFVAEMVSRRTAGDFAAARALWAEFSHGRQDELREAYSRLIRRDYVEICAALEGAKAFVTYGNVDRPDLLRELLPESATFVDAGIIEIEGHRVGFAGGGTYSIGTPGEVDDDAMRAKLSGLGVVDVLATHVPPAVPALASDIIGGRHKGSMPVLEYIQEFEPARHFFGDIHQPQASRWRIGPTLSENVGYFRATGRAVQFG